MTQVTLNKLNKDIQDIKVKLNKIVNILEEEHELTEIAKKELEEARKTPLAEYVDLSFSIQYRFHQRQINFSINWIKSLVNTLKIVSEC